VVLLRVVPYFSLLAALSLRGFLRNPSLCSALRWAFGSAVALCAALSSPGSALLFDTAFCPRRRVVFDFRASSFGFRLLQFFDISVACRDRTAAVDLTSISQRTAVGCAHRLALSLSAV